MEEFIVLGLVPGTSIQIDFFAWLKMAAIFTGLIVIYSTHRRISKRTYANTFTNSKSKKSAIFVSKPFNKDTSIAL